MTADGQSRPGPARRRMSAGQLWLVGVMLCVVIATQLLSYLSYRGMTDATDHVNQAQNLSGTLANAQREALRAQLMIEGLSDGSATVTATQLRVGYLGQQLQKLLARDLSPDARAHVVDAADIRRRIAATLARIEGEPPSTIAATVPSLRADSRALDATLHGLHSWFEVAYYRTMHDTLQSRRANSGWLIAAAVMSVLIGLGLIASLRRAVRVDFDRAYALLRAEADERVTAELAVRRSEQRFRALVQNSSDVILILDAAGIVLSDSPALYDLPGVEASSLVGCSPLRLVERRSWRRVSDAFVRCRAASDELVVVDLALLRRDAEEHEQTYFEITLTNMLDDEAVAGIVVNGHDVTDRVARARELEHLAFHDSITGLPNRVSLERRLDQLTAAGDAAAVLVVDIDGFKAVNSALSDVSPEEVLRAVGRRLSELVGDDAMVAHPGGDEFVVLVIGTADDVEAMVIGDNALNTLRATRVGAQHLALSASIGIAAGRCDQVHGHELLRRADSAMHQAKENGRGRIALFDEQGYHRRSRHTALAEALARAVDHDELTVHYQPWVASNSGRIVGAEALLRWRHNGRLMPPSDFIGVAESSGLIIGLGTWVLDRACRDLYRWQCAHDGEALSIAVNVSARQLHDPDFLLRIEDIIVRHHIDPLGLIVELTESALVEDPRRAQYVLAQLNALDVRVAIDDFGTGYSSLSYLMQLAVDIVKLDKAFVDEVTTNARAQRLLRGIVELAHDLDMRVTVEGVETAEQLEIVTAAGCDNIQGFYLARPGTAEQIDAVLWSTSPAVGDRA